MQITTRKIIYPIFILILLSFGVFFIKIYSLDEFLKNYLHIGETGGYVDGRYINYCSDTNGRKMNCEKCVKMGKLIPHSFGSTCEIPAKDAGKKCIYSDECAKGCFYENKDSEVGACKEFSSEERWGGCSRKRGEQLDCSFDMS